MNGLEVFTAKNARTLVASYRQN